jgi:hypothetical protein
MMAAFNARAEAIETKPFFFDADVRDKNTVGAAFHGL